jgi:glycosyltransferase involved in cell wall biosynthesis
MAFHRHFVERNDVDLFVATTEKNLPDFSPPYPYLIFDQPAWLERLTRTRFGAWFDSIKDVFLGNFIPKKILDAAREFHPDIIMTIGGSWDWTSQMARRLAKKLDLPLIASFNDWFDYSIIIHPFLKPIEERLFRSLYRVSDLALCTSEGMRDALGDHRNAHVLYPIGSVSTDDHEADEISDIVNRPLIAAFAGSMTDWYGPMLESLVLSAESQSAPITFRFYGRDPSWSSDFDLSARSKGIYLGQLPFERLRKEIKMADLLILPMGFGEECAQVERTSFKTKFLDYLTYRKPILVWGPDYCSAVRVAKEFDSGEVCSTASPWDVIQKMINLRDSVVRRRVLVSNGQKMYQDRFHPERIHHALLEKIRQLVLQ